MRSGRERADAPAGAISQALIVGRGDCLHQHFLSTSACCWLPVSAAPKPFVDTGRGCHRAGLPQEKERDYSGKRVSDAIDSDLLDKTLILFLI